MAILNQLYLPAKTLSYKITFRGTALKLPLELHHGYTELTVSTSRTGLLVLRP